MFEESDLKKVGQVYEINFLYDVNFFEILKKLKNKMIK
jgi:hypothetical protein